MADIRLFFTLTVKPENRDSIVSDLQNNEINVTGGIDVKTLPASTGKIVCFVTIPENDTEEAINTCSWISNLEGVTKMMIRKRPPLEDKAKTPKDWKAKLGDSTEWLKAVPLLPMIISGIVTFFIVFTAIDPFVEDMDFVTTFKLAGIPAIVAFLTQFLHEYYQWWKERRQKTRWG
jgi:hypothetical protein